jgi:hypothetical protein
MTLIKNLIGFIALTSLLFSCKKEMSLEGVKSPVITDASWEFTESGKIFKGNIDTAYINEGTGFNVITLHGITEDGTTGQIILQALGEPLAAGTYTEDRISFLYTENGEVVYRADDGSAGFSITITEIDSASVTGTFTGVAKGSDGSEKTIVDGKFTAPIAKENVETIEPDPNNSDYFTFGTKWVYANSTDATDLVTITAVSDTVINGFLYKVFENDRTGEHKYYRKDANNFYQFSSVKFGGDTEANDIDLLILKQDAAAFEPWATDPYSFTLSGTPAINAKIVNEISGKDYSATLEGIRYENLIEVDTHLEVEIGGEYSPAPGAMYYTIFSKGIGIVSYFDFNLEAYYVLKSYTP